ncbi:MAG: hypothetical protein KDA93_13965 [Planctomycetaceae bacterium]|nr:hypothetical protein [Planctomycetaceae bacterium]
MSKSLIIKELRETWWLGLIAALLLGLYLFVQMGYQPDVFSLSFRRLENYQGRLVIPQPFLVAGFREAVLWIAAGLGLIVGFWQTVSESVQGTWLFLLHRPLSRQSVILSKLVSGLMVTAVAIAVPLLMYLMWAMTPGTHANPFELWMTTESIVAWLVGLTTYLAAFLCGMRGARWYASRLVPLVPVLFFGLMIFGGVPGLITPLGFATLPVDVILIAVILFTARHRDYA